MNNFRHFQTEKNSILRIYDNLLDSYNLAEHEVDELKQYKRNLVNEKFIVSVCGQINVGKSTFLNDLLFEDNVLPTKEVVETAKLTTISFGETHSYKVVFYSEAEWKKLKEEYYLDSSGNPVINDTTGGPYTFYDYSLKPSINQRILSTGNLGIEKESIDKKIAVGTNFMDLKQFISADGIYTPFVKTVHLSYPSEILKDTVIVDTPGTNDPNTVRSKLTEDWIGNSDAVIYLMYGGQALTAQDQEFILKYLLPVPSDKIIIGLSKIDTVDDYNRPRKYVETNFKRLEQFQKAIEHKTIYPVSPMYSLYPKLYRKFKAGEILLADEDIEDIEFQLFERGEEFQALIDQQGFMPEFIEAIETLLLKNKGQALLSSHKQKVISFFENRIRNLIREREQAVKKLTLSQLNYEQIAKKTAELNDYIELIRTKEEYSLARLTDSFTVLENSINQTIFDMFEKINDKAFEEIGLKSIDYLIYNLSWFIKNQCENFIYYGSFTEDIDKYIKDFTEELEGVLYSLKNDISNLNIISAVSLDALFSVIAYKPMMTELEGKINSKVSNEILKKLDENNKFWFIRFKKEQTKSEIKGVVNKLLSSNAENGLKESISGIVITNFQKGMSRFMDSLFGHLKEELSTIRNYLKTLQNEKGQEEVLESKIKDEIQKIEMQIQEIEKQKSELLEQLSSVTVKRSI